MNEDNRTDSQYISWARKFTAVAIAFVLMSAGIFLGITAVDDIETAIPLGLLGGVLVCWGCGGLQPLFDSWTGGKVFFDWAPLVGNIFLLLLLHWVVFYPQTIVPLSVVKFVRPGVILADLMLLAWVYRSQKRN
jgi:hypothetical protein